MPAKIRRDDCTDVKRMLWTNSEISRLVCVGLGGGGWRQEPVALKPHHPPTTPRYQLDIKQQDRFAGVAASPTRYAFFAYGC